MTDARARSLDQPDESLSFEHGSSGWVVMGDVTVARVVLEPGWRWSTHIKPVVGTEWCESRHVGVMLSGRLHVRTDTGVEYEIAPNDVYEIPAGHDGWVVGDEPSIAIEWSGVRGWATPLESMRERILATIVFTDIVASTATAAAMGDRRWHDLLSRHNVRGREVLSRFGGREVATTGDGFLAIFDGAARAVRCAAALVEAAAADGIAIRASVHTGEVELAGSDLRGVTVHEASRLLALAASGEVVVSAVTKELSASAGFRFADRGDHELKGLDGHRRVYALVP